MKITRRNNSNNNLPVRSGVNQPISLHNMIDRMFDDSFWSPFDLMKASQSTRQLFPQVDVSETDTVVKVRANIPGIDPDNINLEVSEDVISISGSFERNDEENEENYYRVERSAGRFSREFTLPAKVDVDSVKANSNNGVIEITLNKQPQEQRKKVTIDKS